MASSPSKPPSTQVKVYVLLFLEDPCRLLTIHRNGKPHLPRFSYDQNHPYSPQLCCNDLAKSLQLPLVPDPFRVVAELLPPVNDSPVCSLWNPDGCFRLLLIDTTDSVDLSFAIDTKAKSHCEHSAELTDASVVFNVVYARENGLDYRYLYSAASHCMSPCRYSHFLSSGRCGHTRVQGGIEFLQRFVCDSGLTPKSSVMRHAWDTPWPLFRIDTDDGWYYIKMPIAGAKETSITQCISRLFPNDTLLVNAIDLSLNCFISKGFDSTYRSWDRKICATKLARLQLESIDHLETLKKAGLPDYSTPVLMAKIEELAADPRYSSKMEAENISKEQVTRTIKHFCSELDKSTIPNTLVHGDLASRNFGLRSEVEQDDGLILYDWEGACLSHPFCDLYNNLDEWGSKRFLDEYLPKWSRFVNMEEAIGYAQIGMTLGAIVRICHLMKLETVALGQDKSMLEWSVGGCIETIVESVQKKEYCSETSRLSVSHGD